MSEAEGKCLCGAVKVSVSSRITDVDACHCKMCRNWGGGPLMVVNSGDGVEFEGEENIATYDSSEWAERGFCRNCGSHLFYRLKGQTEYQIPVGIFEDQSGYHLALQVFVDSKPDFYCFANQTKEMTGEEVFAEFAPEQKT